MSAAPSEPGRVLLSVTGIDPGQWLQLLSTRRDVVLAPDGPADPTIRYAVVWKHPDRVLERLPNLKAVFSTGAGVDHLLNDPGLPEVPIVRVVADNLTQHMVEYVVWRVLDHHRQGDLYRRQQADKVWAERDQRSAPQRSVGIMGLGTLGRAAAVALARLGFVVHGWSRRPQAVDGVACHNGADGLAAFLAASEILVVLLPLTPATTGIIDHALLKGLPRGAVLINAGRGRLQKEADILRALDDGMLAAASLDVFEREPLPGDSPLWRHPRVFVTPHAAATSDPAHLAGPMLDQMDAFDRGAPLVNVVDRAEGY